MISHDSAAYLSAANKVAKELSSYLEKSQKAQTHVVNLRPMSEISEELKISELIRSGGLDNENLTDFLRAYLDNSMHMHHPHYIGHQVAIPHPAAALADMIHGLICNPMSIYEMGPAAATIEVDMINWMLEKVGWQINGAGLFTHGGSLANIHAMLAARSAVDPDAWTKGVTKNLVVLAPENTHYSIARAISIIGLGSETTIPIPTDRHEVVLPDRLQSLIREQRSQGKQIMAVVANACATSTGIYDPVDEMADICQENNCWFHVDSPHGATALLSGKYQSLLKGIEKADSMIWDAHKMMQTSSLSTGLLFREKRHFQQTLNQKASYLIHEKENPGFDVLPYQIECTKSAIATKLFFVLAAIGEKGMGKFIDTLYDNSREFAKIINDRPGFDCHIPVESNIILFRYKPEIHHQLHLREKLVKTGEFYITSTEVKGVRYLRLVVMNESTNRTTIEALLDKIQAITE